MAGTEQPDQTELTPRTYADLLAILDDTPLWVMPDAAGDGAIAGVPDLPQAELDYFAEREIADALKIDVLGQTEDGKEIEVYSEHLHRTVRMRDVARLRYGSLLQHLGLPVKRSVLISGADDVPGMFGLRDTLHAISLLGSLRVCSDETKLGPGVWPVTDGDGETAGGAGGPSDSGHGEKSAVVLVNASEAMHFNGRIDRITHPRHQGHLLSFESGTPPWYNHDELAGLLGQAASLEFRQRVADELRNLFSCWRWRGKQDPLIASGLVLATWVQAIWAWRPRIDVLGASNTGKSMLCTALAGLFRDLVILTSDTTAAGLRQKICNSARVVIVDEVDAKNRSKVARQREILEMLRSASRGTSAIRGSGSGKAVEFTLRHLVWVAGISLNYDDQADRNRAVCLNLLPPTREMAGKLVLPPNEDLHDLGQRSLAASLWGCQEARCMAVGLKDVRIDGVDQRLVESYAVPAAMMSVILGMDQAAAGGMLKMMLSDASTDSQQEPDETMLVADILGATVQLESHRLTVGQAVELAMDLTASNRDAWRTVLEASGVKLDLGAVQKIIFHYQLVRRKLLYGTRWQEQSIDQYLRRIDGCECLQRRVGGSKGRTCLFPLRAFVETYIGDKDGENEPVDIAELGDF